MSDARHEVEVLSGTGPDDLRWVVICQPGARGELYTLLRVYSGGDLVVAGSGFGGPALAPGAVLNEWRGRTGDLPFFVMARTAPEVDRVVATTDRGRDVELKLSEPVAEFGLRFAAGGLPPGHAPQRLRAESQGITMETRSQPVPPPRP